MMRILILHPETGFQNYNTGDFLTFLGGKNVLSNIYEDVQFIYFDWKRADRDVGSYLNLLNFGVVDIVAILGIPCITHHENDPVFKFITALKIKFKTAKFIALGIGQGYGFPVELPELFIDMSVVNIYKGFDLITTRDFLSHLILNNYGISNTYFYDLSSFSGYFFKRDSFDKRRSLLIFQDYPGYYLSDKLVDMQLDLIKKYDATIITLDISSELLSDRYGINISYVGDIEYLARLYRSFDIIVTTKVHQSVLAHLMGADVFCIPIDMRYLTLEPFGVNIINPLDTELWIPDTGLPKFKFHNNYITQYKELFNSVGL